jgi:hypothetical protein
MAISCHGSRTNPKFLRSVARKSSSLNSDAQLNWKIECGIDLTKSENTRKGIREFLVAELLLSKFYLRSQMRKLARSAHFAPEKSMFLGAHHNGGHL